MTEDVQRQHTAMRDAKANVTQLFRLSLRTVTG